MGNPQQPSSAGIGPGKLGERLRLAREARGVSVEGASEQASVPIRYLRMFEEGRYPVVADPAYLTHFVRRYATYLGLDAWQASRDFIAETEPETALRRAGKLTAEPTTLEPPMTNARPNSSSDKGKGGSGGGSPPATHAEKRFKFDAGPISLVGAAVTLGLFLLNLWMQGRPEATPVVEEKTAATSPAAEAPRSAPAAVSAPAASAPPAAEAPAAAPAPESPPQAAAPGAPPAPSAEAAPPSSAPAASASATRAEPPPAPAAPSAEIHATRREPQAAAPATAEQPAPPAAKSEPVPAAAAPQRKSRIDATNKASEALRAEQLERMKARTAGGDGGATGASGAAATGNPTTAAGQ
jgi:cytoskeletal protein RodZ